MVSLHALRRTAPGRRGGGSGWDEVSDIPKSVALFGGAADGRDCLLLAVLDNQLQRRKKNHPLILQPLKRPITDQTKSCHILRLNSAPSHPPDKSIIGEIVVRGALAAS